MQLLYIGTVLRAPFRLGESTQLRQLCVNANAQHGLVSYLCCSEIANKKKLNNLKVVPQNNNWLMQPATLLQSAFWIEHSLRVARACIDFNVQILHAFALKDKIIHNKLESFLSLPENYHINHKRVKKTTFLSKLQFCSARNLAINCTKQMNFTIQFCILHALTTVHALFPMQLCTISSNSFRLAHDVTVANSDKLCALCTLVFSAFFSLSRERFSNFHSSSYIPNFHLRHPRLGA